MIINNEWCHLSINVSNNYIPFNRYNLLQKMSALVTLLVLLTIHSAETCDTFKPIKNYVLTGHVIKTIRDANFEKCTYRCELETKCFSINLYTKTSKCELNYGSKEMFPSDFKEELDALYIHNIRKDTGDPCNALYCLHGGSCHPFPQPNCMCPVGFVGSICQNISKDWIIHWFIIFNNTSILNFKNRQNLSAR